MIEPAGDCPFGETSRRGFWGGRFKDLLSSQGVHFQVNQLEKAIASVPDVSHPTLEFVVTNPKGSADPLRIRVEVGTDRTDADKGPIGDKVRAAVLERL